MILTVTLNSAIDRTVAVPSFRLGRRHRAIESRTVAGGKGVNVARALKMLGRPVIATGLAGGPTGTRILAHLGEESILNDFTRIESESRTNLSVVDPTTGQQTEINERGPQVSAAELERFVDKLLYLARGARVCVLCGSVPPGVDDTSNLDIYERLVTELNQIGVITVLDTDGEPMRAAMRAGPAIVSPNLLEAEAVVGHEFADIEDLAAGLDELTSMGAHEAIITRHAGCVASVIEDGTRKQLAAVVDQLDPIAAVGSGDAFLAGFVAARYEGRSASECLAYGVACGAESTQHFGAGALDLEQVEKMLSRVTVTELDAEAAAA